MADETLKIVGGNAAGQTLTLEQDVVIGRSTPGLGSLGGDSEISRVHARVFHDPSGRLMIEDLGSTNGTYVNGKRIVGEWRLRAGDELQLGSTRLVLKGSAPADGSTTRLAEPPRLTGRERDVLVELCRPFSTGGAFSEPASVHEIALALVVTDPAVKHHLANLYDKFEIAEGPRRRARLANAALTTGAVGMADFRAARS